MRGKSFIIYVLCCIFMFSANLVFAQEEKPKNQMLIVHEDIVKPSMVTQYEKAARNLVDNLTKHGITSFNYFAAVSEDLHYLYVSPIEKMADLDKNPEKEIVEKMGEEATKAMWKQFDNCYDTHKDFIVTRLTALSYQPENYAAEAENMNFIHWNFYSIIPGKESEARAVAKEWRALYESKNVPTGYNLYIGGLGTDMPLYVTTERARDAEHYQAMQKKVMELLGEEGKKLNARTMALTNRLESKDGWARPDLSYTPNPELSAK